jgi:hypothetical protein
MILQSSHLKEHMARFGHSVPGTRKWRVLGENIVAQPPGHALVKPYFLCPPHGVAELGFPKKKYCAFMYL